jgi:hypothetical protein
MNEEIIIEITYIKYCIHIKENVLFIKNPNRAKIFNKPQNLMNFY